jgi:hypothetical protein
MRLLIASNSATFDRALRNYMADSEADVVVRFEVGATQPGET